MSERCYKAKEGVTSSYEAHTRCQEGVRKRLLYVRKVLLGVRKVVLGFIKVLERCYYVRGIL